MNIFVSDLIGLKPINKYVKSSKQKARARGGGETPLIPLHAPKNDVDPRLKSIEK